MPIDMIRHDLEIEHADPPVPPRLHFEFTPNRGPDTLRVRCWEECPACCATLEYYGAVRPWRRFWSEWRGATAVWLATWEHRHQLGSRVTRS